MTSKEALERIGNYPVGSFGIFTIYDKFKEEINTIKQDLERLEELEKVLNLIKNHYIKITLLGDLQIYNLNSYVEIGKYITEDELKLVVEVLNNDK